MQANLTELTVKNLKPSDKQVTYWDTQLKGFGLMVSPGGTKTFTMMIGKARRRETIGRYGIITLAEARQEARTRLANITLGRHTHRHSPISAILEAFTEALGTHR